MPSSKPPTDLPRQPRHALLAFGRQLIAAQRRPLLLAVCLAALQSFVLIPVPLVAGMLIDRALTQRSNALVLLVGVVICLLYLLNAGLHLWTRRLVIAANTEAVKTLRLKLIERLLQLPHSFYTHADHGQLHAQVVQDSERAALLGGMLVDFVLPSLLSAAMIAAVLCWLYLWLPLILFLVGPVFFLLLRWLARGLKPKVQVWRAAHNEHSSGIQWLIQALELVKQSGAQALETDSQTRLIERLQTATATMDWAKAKEAATQQTLVGVSSMLVLLVGAHGLMTGWLTTGQMIALYFGFTLLRNQAFNVMTALPHLVAGWEALRTLHDFLQADLPQPYQGRRQVTLHGHVRCTDLWFRYETEWILRGVDFALAPGEQVALIGASGVGKSTVVNLLLGFYRPERGEICFDNITLGELDPVCVRQQLALVPQNPLLLSASIRENINYGWRPVTLAEIERAARLAGIHEFIASLPEQYESAVGERGLLLSGGQRQRLALARALLRRPKLLILDEPTNHLDTEAIAHFVHSLKNLEDSPATLIISHNIDVVRAAQRVLILRAGRLQEDLFVAEPRLTMREQH